MTVDEKIRLKQISESVGQGNPLTMAQLEALRRIGSSDASVLMRRSVRLAEGMIRCGNDLSPECLRALAELRTASSTPTRSGRTGADRVRDYVSRASDIGEIPEPINASRREACRHSLIDFGLTYCSTLLDHAPSDAMRPFIDSMQRVLLTGGKLHVRWPRGKGKTSWTKIGALWSATYGHRRFIVIISATADDAKEIVGDILDIVETSDAYAEDFPEVAFPIRALEGVVQRCATQHSLGSRTKIEIRDTKVVFPTVAGSVASGAIIRAKGIKGSLRGLVKGSQRPDFVFLDDPQTRKDASSPSETRKFISVVQGDVDGLAGHRKQMATIYATTPVCSGDGSTRLADPEEFPNVQTITSPLIIRYPDRLDLWDEWTRIYRAEGVAGNELHTDSRAYYLEHRAEMDAGAVMLDPADGDPVTEEGALHHAMIKRATLSEEAFLAEYQMTVSRQASVFELTPSLIMSHVTAIPQFAVPIACSAGVVAFCDVNASAGLRWGVMAVGPRNVCHVVAYGRYPAVGRLFPENSAEAAVTIAVARGLRAVAQHIASLPLFRNRRRVTPWALCFDGGWQTATVAAFCQSVRAPMKVIWSKGFGSRNYRPPRTSALVRLGDNCHLSESVDNGTFLAVNADYWREVAQRAHLAEPFAAGGISLFQGSAETHADWIAECCAERLLDKGVDPSSGKPFWRWQSAGPNHFGDVLSGLFATASWFGLLSPAKDLMLSDIAANAPQPSGPAAALPKAPSTVTGATPPPKEHRLPGPKSRHRPPHKAFFVPFRRAER